MDISQYYEKILKEPLLSKEEEQDLFLELKDPGISKKRKEEIRDRVIRANLRFAFKRAKAFSKKDPSIFPELISAANEGLIAGFDKYDLDRGFRFLTYVGWWVEQRILMHMASQRLVKLPIWRQQLAARIQRVVEANEDITFEDLLTHFPDYSEADIRELFDTKFLTFYIEDLGEDQGFEINPIESDVNRRLDMEKVNLAVEKLPELHCKIIQMSFGLGQEDEIKPRNIAKELGISKQQLRQIKKEALDMLKEMLGGVNPFSD